MKRVLAYGTFDLFHIGHLNFLKRAKEFGDYLIVGVSTDEFNRVKGKDSLIPYEERKSIIEALEYVDEVISEENWAQKKLDVKKYNIDVVVTTEEWKYKFDYLKEYVDVVYLKRTPNISTTLIKKNIIKKYKKHKRINIFVKGGLYIFKYTLRFIYAFMKLFKTNPRKVVFISRMSNDLTISYKMYLDKLKEYDVKTVVLCKRIETGLKGYIKYIPEIFKQMYHLATSKICVLDSYCIPVSILNHKKDLKIIQTWHAMMAVKKFGYQNLNEDDGRKEEIATILNMHKNYDYIVSGSKAMSIYFCEAFGVNIEKIHEIGSPTIDYLIKNKETLKEKIYSLYPDLKAKPNVLYVPTFRKGRELCDDDLINNFDYQNYNLIIKYHVSTKKKILDSRVFECKSVSSIDLLTIADYIITDYSSIAAEASLFNKPILYYVYDIDEYKEKNGLNIDLYSEMPDCVYKDAIALLDKIKKNDFNYENIKKFRKKYVNNINGTSAALLVDYIISNLKEVSYEQDKILSSYIYEEK